ncbi:MAG TPA: RecX family transcriptional regulator [Stellaceae bacterium]|nr:RecX family transcriptional regulator [Stellaceae bacterium]
MLDPSGGAAHHRGMRRRPIPDLSEAAIERAALHYLERFAASSEQLRRVLLRRVKRATMLGAESTEGARARIDALIARYLSAGLLDDRRFAESQAGSLQRRGTSQRRIRQRLAAKGVAAEFADAALADLAERAETGELASAAALVRRRRLGPYRAPGARAEHRQKDLAALARAGFSLSTARQVLAAATPEALDALTRGEDE